MKDSGKLVSIGLPVYNGENFIREAIDSLLSQTYANFELIISDNASTDGTKKICLEYASKDNRVKYHRNEENIGGGRNYNRVFELSKGEYFKWAAHDDVCSPEFLERCIEELELNPSIVLAYPQTQIIDEHGVKKERIFSNGLDLRSSKPDIRLKHYYEVIFPKGKNGRDRVDPIWGVIRSSALKETNLIGNYFAGDWVLLVELALLGKFHEIPEIFFFRRYHGQRAMYVNPSPLEGLIWFDPTAKGKIIIPRWQLLTKYIACVRHHQMSRQTKVRCYILVGKWFITWGGVRVTKDLLLAINRFIKLKLQ